MNETTIERSSKRPAPPQRTAWHIQCSAEHADHGRCNRHEAHDGPHVVRGAKSGRYGDWLVINPEMDRCKKRGRQWPCDLSEEHVGDHACAHGTDPRPFAGAPAGLDRVAYW